MQHRSVRAHNAALLYARFSNALEAIGLTLEVRTDFDALARIYEEGSGRPVFPVFDPEQSDIGPANGFWICGRHDGEIVHVQAMRHWMLGDTTLTDHLQQHIRLYCFPDAPIVPSRTVVRHDNSDMLSGHGIYHGQMWLDQSLRGQTVENIPLGRELLPKMAFLIAILTGAPKFIFGMAPYPTAEKGILASYGYYHNDLAALTFCDKDGEPQWYETILWSTLSDVDAEIDRTIQRLDLADRHRQQVVTMTQSAAPARRYKR